MRLSSRKMLKQRDGLSCLTEEEVHVWVHEYVSKCTCVCIKNKRKRSLGPTPWGPKQPFHTVPRTIIMRSFDLLKGQPTLLCLSLCPHHNPDRESSYCNSLSATQCPSRSSSRSTTSHYPFLTSPAQSVLSFLYLPTISVIHSLKKKSQHKVKPNSLPGVSVEHLLSLITGCLPESLGMSDPLSLRRSSLGQGLCLHTSFKPS